MDTTITSVNWFDINYIEGNAYYTHFIPLLNNKRVANYCEKQLYRSLSYIGFSKSFCDSFIPNLGQFDFDTFHQNFDAEIKEVNDRKFMEVAVPKYLTEKIIPSIPSAKLVLDIGCGNGILMKQLANSGRFDRIIGCEWDTCPKWNEIIQEYGDRIQFYVVKDDEFSPFVKTHNPDAFVLVLVLHHMELPTQYKYIKNLFDTMNPGTRLVIIEEGISTTLLPEMGQNEHDEFMTFSHQERQDVLTIYDWIANIFLERRAMPIPSTNRAMEEWETFFSEMGFDILSKRYIGWSVRNVINPQQLFVLERPNNDN